MRRRAAVGLPLWVVLMGALVVVRGGDLSMYAIVAGVTLLSVVLLFARDRFAPGLLPHDRRRDRRALAAFAAFIGALVLFAAAAATARALL